MANCRWVGGSLVLAWAFAASSAAAEAKSSTTDGKGDGSYRVVFDDDPLEAGEIGPIGARIAIAARAARATLIRPRTAFVLELLKSVENL